MRCPSCGAQHHGSEVTCLLCGALMAFSPEELERVERFRLSANTELLCVMFADVSGFSGISDRSLSQSQRILQLHTALTQAVVERDRSGEVVNTAGDGVLAVFSNPATAAERALELHAAVHHYHQGTITDGYLAETLRGTRLPLHPSLTDEEYKIHIGMHLGLVTRGGRTSRDVFGHNVNIACRLCDLADKGQTFMSEAVYDNARLILGAREDLEWKVWKEQPIRGIAAPMTVVGLGQQPYNVVTPPRGSKLPPPAKTPLFRRTAVWVPSVILVAGILAAGAWVMRQRLLEPKPTSPPRQAALPVSAEDDLPPLVAELPLEPAPDTPPVADPAPPDATPPAGDPDNAANSATNTSLPADPGATPPDGQLPPPAGQLQPPVPPDGADLDAFQPELMKTAASVTFDNSGGKLPATLLASRGKDGLLLAVGLPAPVHDAAEMALLIDGDCDGKLLTQSVAPFVDLMLLVGGLQDGAAPLRCNALLDGKSGAELVAAPGLTARRLVGTEGVIWLFRLPFSQLTLSGRKYAQFKLEYRPDGAGKPTYVYPGKAPNLRRLEIPR